MSDLALDVDFVLDFLEHMNTNVSWKSTPSLIEVLIGSSKVLIYRQQHNGNVMMGFVFRGEEVFYATLDADQMARLDSIEVARNKTLAELARKELEQCQK